MVFGLLAAVGLGWLLPDWGARGGVLHSEVTGKASVFVIFLLQGMSLQTERLKTGLLAWRLHLTAQLLIFGVMPLLAWLLTRVGGGAMDPSIRMGFLYLGILPTTVATAVVLTAQAGGNVSGALFNTCLSNVIGVIFVPLMAALWTRAEGASVPVGPLLLEVAALLLLPLMLGQLVRPWLREVVEARRAWIGRINSGLILFIVFTAFANSVKSDVWSSRGVGSIAGTALGSFLLLLAGSAAALLLSRVARLGREDRAAAFYCGSQKTIAAGIPMAQSIFSGTPYAVGLVILPVMFYHLMQLMLGVLLTERLRKSPATESPRA